MRLDGPLVTIVVPVLNEALHIRDCVLSIATQTYPPDRLEVLFIDGGSTDGTAGILELQASALLRSPWRVLTNPRGDRSTSLNLGLAAAQGDVLVRIDARSRPAPNYVAGCVQLLERRREVGVVGGAQVAIPRSDAARDRGIARALQNRWTTGLSRYRLGRTSGPSDTVWLGAFRTPQLRALGGWNVEVGINEDYELNERYRKTGAVVWFEADLRTGYVPRSGLSTLGDQYVAYGRTKGERWRAGAEWRPRHMVLVGIPPTALLLIVLAARRLGLPRVASLVAVALVGVEATGGAEVHGGPAARAVAIAATLTMGGSWWIGVMQGLLDAALVEPTPAGH